MVRVRSESQSLRHGSQQIPSYIQYNYIQSNWYIDEDGEYVDNRPRSFAVGAFGLQRVDIHYNRLRNALMDFEVVTGCRVSDILYDIDYDKS